MRPSGSLAVFGAVSIAMAVAIAAANAQTATSAAPWAPPKTAWGEPDLQGVWTSDDSIGVPFERPAKNTHSCPFKKLAHGLCVSHSKNEVPKLSNP
jgi:hypothetical protein